MSKRINAGIRHGAVVLLVLCACTGLASAQQPPREPTPLAQLSFTERDLERAGAVLESWIQQRLAAEDYGKRIPEQIIKIPAPPGSTLDEVLRKLQSKAANPIQLAVRLPEKAVSIQVGKTELSVRHNRGDAQMHLSAQTATTTAAAAGIQVGILENGVFQPLTDGKNELPSFALKVDLPRSSAEAKVNLPEWGTAVTVSDLKAAPLSPDSFEVKGDLPDQVVFYYEQKGGGKGRHGLNKKAMDAIEEAALSATRENLPSLVNDFLNEQSKWIEDTTNQTIQEFRSEFSLSSSIRDKVDQSTLEGVQVISQQIRNRLRNPAAPALQVEKDDRPHSRSRARAVILELQKQFWILPPKAAEFKRPVGLRAALLAATLENLTQDWDKFSSRLARNGYDGKRLAELMQIRDELMLAATGRLSLDEFSKLQQSPTELQARNGESDFDFKLRTLNEALLKLVDEGGIDDKLLATTSDEIYDAVVMGKLSNTTIIEISGSGTRLREQVISITETLEYLNDDPNHLISPHCESGDPSPSRSEARISVAAINRTLARMHQQGTLNLMLARMDGLKLRSAPRLEVGWSDKNGAKIGLGDAHFSFVADIEASGHDFEARIDAQIKTSADGKSLILEANGIKTTYDATLLELLFPPTLILSGIKDIVGNNEAKSWLKGAKHEGTNRLVFDLGDSAQKSGQVLDSFSFDSQNPDSLRVRFRPARTGGGQ